MSLPPKPMSAEDAASLHAEARRLHLEVEKLRLEVADLKRWRAKAVIAVVSAFLAPLITIGTFVLASSASKWAERRRDADALYGKVVQDFASTSLPRRLSAISAMEAFTAQQQEEWWMPRPKAELTAASERSRNAISLLVNTLTTEADPIVVNAIVNLTLTRPDLSLPLLKEANRRAAVEFSRAAGTYTGLLMLHNEKRASMDDSDVSAALRGSIAVGLGEQIARSNQLFDTANDFNAQFLAERFLYGQPYRHLYDRQQRYARRDSTHAKSPVPDLQEVGKAEAEMLQKALFLEATSRALLASLKKPTANAKADQDWNGVAIVCGEFPDPADFSTLDLHSAYWFASIALHSVNFKNANLQDADLTGFHFNHGDLDGMRYEGMKLCSKSTSFDNNAIDPQKVIWVDKQASEHEESDPRCP